MEKRKITERVRSSGPQTADERRRLQDIRDSITDEFPPLEPPRLQPVATGVGFQIRTARESQGLTWNALAAKAGLKSDNVVRDIEYGREVTLSNIEAVAAALGLRLELVEQAG